MRSKTKAPKELTLDEELSEISGGYSRCQHEEDARDEVVGEVRAMLRRRGLLDVKLNSGSEYRCGFCDSIDIALEHRRWCIHK